MTESDFQRVGQLISECAQFKGAKLDRIEPLPGDASKRNYTRVWLQRASPNRLILVQYQELENTKVSSARADLRRFVAVTKLFSSHGLSVPLIYSVSESAHSLLLEDVGELGLWRFAENTLDDEGEKVKDLLGADWLVKLFERAIAVIGQLQSIPQDGKSEVFQRTLSFEQYRREANEFLEYYAMPRNLKPSAQQILSLAFDALCETLLAFPRKLSHFDYTAHNLFVNPEGKIWVLDYQDAAMVSHVRDIVSLINDRGMDEILGKSKHAKLLQYYQETLQPGPEFDLHYEITLLHWDFRVIGRFIKLCQTKGSDKYQKWVPGTLRRLGRTLATSYRRLHQFDDVLEIVTRLSPEAKEGAEEGR